MNSRQPACRIAWLVFLTPLLGAQGCATYSGAPRSYGHFFTGLSVAVPEDWLRHNPDNPDLVITKDGLQLEAIRVSMTRAGKRLEGTERRYQRGMLPHEVADLSLALLEAREDTNIFEVESMDFATIAGHDGFVAKVTYLDETGLKKRMWLFGAMIEGYAFQLLYVAAEPIFFDKYLPVFQRLVASALVKR